ncbi:MAG: 50S ribosomal protein L15 [Bacteroidia bacterium]|nr:50S ribosomal protein L15 [Bacteroidia bacterium]MCX7652696.1 50S ribosomal protein L15 [Bacteroidia bacterium]MDW8416420.1 50S ribosomal protein L15 [Bacteroidia bacterium]
MSSILHSLRPASGAVHKKKRVGRGEGSGHGGTSTRGHKGDQSRSGYRVKRGFEGGQMPYQRRIPKFGFKNPFRVAYFPLNLERISTILQAHPDLDEITPEWLYAQGVVRAGMPIKILARGELVRAVTIKAHKFSAAAQAAIEQVGGKVVSLSS